jgi:hypothetical protein
LVEGRLEAGAANTVAWILSQVLTAGSLDCFQTNDEFKKRKEQ